MKKTDLKLKDTVSVYCTGKKVEGKVIEINETDFLVEHEPVRWGNDIHTKTLVVKSTSFQEGFSPTSPGCWKDGNPILL